MADLAQKITTFFGGTRKEIIEHGVVGINWTIIKYLEMGGGLALLYQSNEDFPKYIGGCLVANTAVRYANMIYKKIREEPNLEHLFAPYPGIIGTIREIRE